MEFLKDHIELVLLAVAMIAFVIEGVRLLKKAKKIDEEGIETNAVVSRIEEDWDPETMSSSYITYAEYRDENGDLRETQMALTSLPEHRVGDKIRIRFLPGERELVREVTEKD